MVLLISWVEFIFSPVARLNHCNTYYDDTIYGQKFYLLLLLFELFPHMWINKTY